jgi:predicted TPR repeat methyltransferase
VFSGVQNCLRPGGLFGFSVEAAEAAEADEGADFLLQPTHRFAHSLGYLKRLGAQQGFSVESVESRVIRKNGDLDVSGYLVVMRRGPG